MQKGKVEILVNDQGHRITPSYVAFTDEERLVGDAAKNQAAANPKRTIFDIKLVTLHATVSSSQTNNYLLAGV
jgi:heat shock protein 5